MGRTTNLRGCLCYAHSDGRHVRHAAETQDALPHVLRDDNEHCDSSLLCVAAEEKALGWEFQDFIFGTKTAVATGQVAI